MSSLKEKGLVFRNNGKWDLSTLFFIKFGVNGRSDLISNLENEEGNKDFIVFDEKYYEDDF
jgi:hypothetical protein